MRHINSQKEEANELRQQLHAAGQLAIEANAATDAHLDRVLQEERQQAAADRQNLLSQISNLIITQGEAQDKRLVGKVAEIRKDVVSARESFQASQAQYNQGMDAWNEKESKLVEEVLRSRESLKSKLKEDWVVSISLFLIAVNLNIIGCKQAQCFSPGHHTLCS